MLGRRDEAHDALGPIFETGILLDQLGCGKALAHDGREPFAVVAERGHHYAALGRRDECPADLGRHRHKTNRLALAAAPPRARRHAEPGGGRLIGARARPEPRRIDRRGDILAGLELLREIAEPVGASIVARRRAGDLLENPMKMKPADPRHVGELGKARRRFAGAQQCAGFLDCRDMARGRRRISRPATFARPQPCRLRRCGCLKKSGVTAQRQPRGATRPAVDAGGLDAVKEPAGSGAVALLQRRPALVEIKHLMLLNRSRA